MSTTISRRHAIAGAAACVLLSDAASALQNCYPGGLCSAMIDPIRFQNLAVPSQQEESQWCWAACIEMICRWHGIKLSQTSIVQRIYGGIVNMPADDLHLTQALNSDWTADDGRQFRINAKVFSPALGIAAVLNDTVINDLANERPMINGSGTHATVVSRVDYRQNPSGGQPIVEQVHVIDPWPGAAHPPQYARFLTQQEMQATQFGGSLRYLASITVI